MGQCSNLYRQFRVTYINSCHEEEHVTVTASNKQGAMNKVHKSKGVVATRAFLIKADV